MLSAIERSFRYFLIFMGVSFGKKRARHEWSPREEAALASLKEGLRRLAAEPLLAEKLAAAAAQARPHLNNSLWRSLSAEDPFVRSLRDQAFAALVARHLPAESRCFLSDPSGAKVAFAEKTALFSHQDANAHRFALRGEEYAETHLRVPFDPDSEVHSVEIGVPVTVAGRVAGSLIGEFSLSVIRRAAA